MNTNFLVPSASSDMEYKVNLARLKKVSDEYKKVLDEMPERTNSSDLSFMEEEYYLWSPSRRRANEDRI